MVVYQGTSIQLAVVPAGTRERLTLSVLRPSPFHGDPNAAGLWYHTTSAASWEVRASALTDITASLPALCQALEEWQALGGAVQLRSDRRSAQITLLSRRGAIVSRAYVRCRRWLMPAGIRAATLAARSRIAMIDDIPSAVIALQHAGADEQELTVERAPLVTELAQELSELRD